MTKPIKKLLKKKLNFSLEDLNGVALQDAIDILESYKSLGGEVYLEKDYDYDDVGLLMWHTREETDAECERRVKQEEKAKLMAEKAKQTRKAALIKEAKKL